MTLQILAKRVCPLDNDDGSLVKRWKASSELKWPIEGITPAATPPPQQPGPQVDVVKLEDQEPTSVLDLQTSPGRSCSSSSGSPSSHPSLSGDDTSNFGPNSAAGTSTDESVHNDHDIASWMECMEDGLALSDFAKCDDDDDDDAAAGTEGVNNQSSGSEGRELEEGINHFVNADIDDFGFELGAFSMSDLLADPGLCLIDGFHDAHRLLELDDSLSSMMNSPGFGVGEAVESSATTTTTTTSSEIVTASEAPLDSGLQLVHLLLACAEAIDESDFDTAGPMLRHLKAISDPHGDPMQRTALYFADALSNRLTSETVLESEPVECPPSTEPLAMDKQLAFQSFYEVLPFSKFTYLTANQAIFEAVGYSNKIHVVDLDIQQGLQWPSFLQTLSMRPGSPPLLHLTAVGTNAAALQVTKRRLTEFAHALDVPFEFTIVLEPLEDLDKENLHLANDDAALAVNCSHVLHRLTGNDAEKLVRFLRSLNPVVVTVLEVEANHNGVSLKPRFVEALHYYCALFDAVEGSLARDSPDRFLIESTTFRGEIRGIVAGHARHVKSEVWHKLLTECGFRSKPLSSYAVQQAQLLLAYFITGDDATPYKLSEDCGALIMGWQDTPVMAVSSWSCC